MQLSLIGSFCDGKLYSLSMVISIILSTAIKYMYILIKMSEKFKHNLFQLQFYILHMYIKTWHNLFQDTEKGISMIDLVKF